MPWTSLSATAVLVILAACTESPVRSLPGTEQVSATFDLSSTSPAGVSAVFREGRVVGPRIQSLLDGVPVQLFVGVDFDAICAGDTPDNLGAKEGEYQLVQPREGTFITLRHVSDTPLTFTYGDDLSEGCIPERVIAKGRGNVRMSSVSAGAGKQTITATGRVLLADGSRGRLTARAQFVFVDGEMKNARTDISVR